jgi:PAS domain S-box-containing protein
VLLGPDGTVEYVIASGLDITEHRALERAMEQAAAYNRSLIEVSLDPLVTIAPDGKITDVNSATERATGRTREELVGTDFSDYFTDPERAREGYEQVFRDGQVTDYELGLVRRDGHVTPVLYNACVYREAGGEVAGVFAAARDITRQREIENALRESEAKYRSLVEEANVVVLNVDSAGTITYMNPFALHFFGYTQEEVLGRNVLGTILAPQDSGGRDMAEMSEAILRGVREHGYNENENVTKDGRRVWMAWSNQPLYDAEGQIKGVLAIGVDRTAQKQAEEMLRGYRESLRSLASELALAEERERRRIAVGIHDQVSQTLALCKLRLGSLGRASSAEPAPEALAEVGNLLDQLISHTRTLTFELSPPILYELGLNSALEWMCETTTSKYGLPCYFEGHEGHLPLAQELGVVLFQGVRELLMNAAQHAQATQVKVSVGRAGQQVVITVADDGVGFDTTTLERAVGESQSFGLFNIRERLQYLGGHLEIESAPGQGTRATLTAPLAE